MIYPFLRPKKNLCIALTLFSHPILLNSIDYTDIVNIIIYIESNHFTHLREPHPNPSTLISWQDGCSSLLTGPCVSDQGLLLSMQSLQSNQSSPFLNINHIPFAYTKLPSEFSIHLWMKSKIWKTRSNRTYTITTIWQYCYLSNTLLHTPCSR